MHWPELSGSLGSLLRQGEPPEGGIKDVRLYVLQIIITWADSKRRINS